MDSSSISSNKNSNNDKARYEVFNEYNERWLEFIPLKVDNEKGIPIIDLKYDNLPNTRFGRWIGTDERLGSLAKRVPGWRAFRCV